jgi:hypothetical protein
LVDRAEISRLLDELADDGEAKASRVRVCEEIADALARLGQLLWLSGAIVGDDRVTGASPFGFGDDRTVGLSAVCQIGGELASGAVVLLKADNRYAANALIRQLVEVEYLADAFAEEHEIAAEWLRADNLERRTFWSPAKLRQRANGRFLNTDYWHHCEMGGHPASPGLRLLPGHNRLNIEYVWADMAGHLAGIWRGVVTAVEKIKGPAPDEAGFASVSATVAQWRSTDGFYAALGDLGRILQDDPNAFTSLDEAPEDAP